MAYPKGRTRYAGTGARHVGGVSPLVALSIPRLGANSSGHGDRSSVTVAPRERVAYYDIGIATPGTSNAPT